MTAADVEPLRTDPSATPARGNACSTPRRSPSGLWRHSRHRLRPDCGGQQVDRGPQFRGDPIGNRLHRAETSSNTLGSIASTITVAVSPGSVRTTTLHGSSACTCPSSVKCFEPQPERRIHTGELFHAPQRRNAEPAATQELRYCLAAVLNETGGLLLERALVALLATPTAWTNGGAVDLLADTIRRAGATAPQRSSWCRVSLPRPTPGFTHICSYDRPGTVRET